MVLNVVLAGDCDCVRRP
ncbi:hypothetical protein ACXZBD_19440 [Escherichia coli]